MMLMWGGGDVVGVCKTLTSMLWWLPESCRLLADEQESVVVISPKIWLEIGEGARGTMYSLADECGDLENRMDIEPLQAT
jgi:hypothetical protein